MTDINDQSILDTIKSALGPDSGYDAFDTELIMHINSAFATLHQLGVGPKTPYHIFDQDNKWSEFVGVNDAIQMVKTYVYMKVRLIFDPPSNSFGITAFEKQCTEYEWRLRAQAETP